MPHQCTGCGEAFPDGSKEMLSGCPECGGNKFQFRPEGAEFPDDPDPPEPEPAEEPPAEESSVTETVGRATTRVRDFVSSGSEAPDPNAAWPSESNAAGSGGDGGDIIDADARREDPDGQEDAAQASARSGLASSDEIRDIETSGEPSPPDAREAAIDDHPGTTDRSTTTDRPATTDDDPGETGGPPTDGDERVLSEPSDEDPDLAELREQLNDQFESIKIVEPGQYELNLMELYDREEYIIALQENGRYVIQVPEQWIGEDADDR